MNWISIEKKLPDGVWSKTGQEYFNKFSEQVLICIDNNIVYVGAYNRESRKWFIGDLINTYQELIYTKVTHWKPLPKPPKNESI